MNDSEKEIFNYLIEIGCCRICCVRYLGYKNVDFSNITLYFNKKEFLDELEGHANSKRSKPNPCIVCLGLLQDGSLDEVVTFVKSSNVDEYDSKSFTCSVSMPACILIREYCIKIDLEERFPAYFTDTEEVALNKAWKWMIRNKISTSIDKEFENSDVCLFSINISLEYEDDLKELLLLKKLLPDNTKIDNATISSRKGISNILASVDKEAFRTVITTPPSVPTAEVKCKLVTCIHNPIYLAGRYCKYSRELSQSPWIIDGVKAMDTSVQELIFDSIASTLRIRTENLKFTASGREDCDVRCLGKGRPFYVEISDPKVTHFDPATFLQLQANINQSKLISVRDLQLVEKSDLKYIKEGEELKTKQYVALCITKVPITQAMLDAKVNVSEKLTIKQKTPIRVLHRRPLAIRDKVIYEMRANAIAEHENLFELKLVTQAGTYVKEFVHGDFGRTKPSMRDFLNCDVDIIALDVSSIDLNWPKEISP